MITEFSILFFVTKKKNFSIIKKLNNFSTYLLQLNALLYERYPPAIRQDD